MSDELPYFPASAPATLHDPAQAAALLGPVLQQLATVVEVPAGDLDRPTPCAAFTVSELRDHVLGWLQFFAAALADPDRARPRLDPDAYRAADGGPAPAAVVRDSAARILAALPGGVLEHQVVMSQSRMDGAAVAAMALGEYLVHGWDLARAAGLPWPVADDACEAARQFLMDMIAPQYRGPEGFFGPEVAVAPGASALDQLIGFAGRDPAWQPA